MRGQDVAFCSRGCTRAGTFTEVVDLADPAVW
jgi:hypothetical protein